MASIIKYILFDCMETLIDLTELPTMRDYAFWAYNGSGAESLWGSFEDFYSDYIRARKSMEEKLPKYREYEILERFKLAAAFNAGSDAFLTPDETAKMLYDNYWRNYVSKCYVKSDVMEVLPELSKKYHLGVVSNFMVENGIEELLLRNNIKYYFKFVVTSVKEGWRKPYNGIYNIAIEKTGVNKDYIMFIGDDYINDYKGPGSIGIKAVLLDRNNKYPQVDKRIRDFYQLENYISGEPKTV